MASKVYFSKEITPEKVVEMYKALGIELPGKVACKVHSGEAGNKNFIHPEFWKPMVDYVNGTVVECNTAYPGQRITTDQHKKVLSDHGWDKYYDVDIMDAEGPDKEVKIENGLRLDKNFLGKDIDNYDSMLVLIHFKGHGNGGYGGALKQLSIGCASSAGKSYIHSGGKNTDRYKTFTKENLPTDKAVFPESMADAAGTVVRQFEGKIAYITLMKNMSVDCDCVGVALPPEIEDVGILASTDPVAIDQACIDKVWAHPNPKRVYLIDRINSRNGLRTISAAEEIGYGSREYELIDLDK